MPDCQISIAITTHNRVADLAFTLERLEPFRGAYHELLVCADGCSDGTQALVRERHPDALLLENNPGRGSIPARNRLIMAASAPLVLLLDDDSYPIEPHFFAEVARVMEAHPRIGVLTFPQRSDEFPETLQQPGFGPSRRVGTFTSSGSVLRKSLFLELGGFPEMFFHAYEEPDFSLRVHAAGFLVVLWTGLTVRHHYSGAMRDEGRTHRRHARNEFWSTAMRAPLRILAPMLLYRLYSQGRYAWRRGGRWLVREPLWWGQALRGLPAALRQRQPVPWPAYRSWLALLRHPEPITLEGVP